MKFMMQCLNFIMIFYFGNVIIDIIRFNNNSSNKYHVIGNSWFYGILFVNIIILVFIISYYNYVKSTSVGKIGLSGYPGIKGADGEPCKYSTC